MSAATAHRGWGPLRRIANAALAGFRAFGFDASGGSGRWPKESMIWARTRQELQARPILANRSAWLVENSPSARAIEDQWADNLVGDGPSARSNHPDPATARALENEWARFYRQADIEGGDLCELLRRVVRSVVGTGDGFLRIITTADGEQRLQLLSSEQIDPTKNLELADGGRIIAGVEVGPLGERRAFWVRPQSPDYWLSMISPPIRIDASEILHCYEPRHAGQVRGYSWLSAVATRLLELDRLEDSLLARMRTSALFAGFITDPENQSGLGAGTQDPQELSMEPGSLRVLPPGASITFPDVPGVEGAPLLLKHMLRSIASGSGIPFALISSDLSDTNYSSCKFGLGPFRRRVKALQSSMLTARLLAPAWRRLISLAIVSGRLRAPGFVNAPDDYLDVNFLWPAWDSIEPLREAEADQVLLANGIKSRAQIVSERGRDLADVDRELAADPRPLPTPQPIAANPMRA
jgi:lambda family phage portal protein